MGGECLFFVLTGPRKELSVIASGMFMAIGELSFHGANTEGDLVWAPLYLAVNGAFTILITARILYVTCLQQSMPILMRMTVFSTGEHHLVLPALS
jgi:hypothetical protein